MKYGKGTDLPGMPHSQGAHIGVIYVSPDDDRKTVLTAILAEDRLKREQIVLDLPQKNKAFQRPEDFDDLKMLRRKIQAKLIFVTPAGPGPAEFARQRRFDVFSSMQSFVSSLTTGSTSQPGRTAPATSQPNKPTKRGFFGGGAKKAATAAASGIVAGEVARRAGAARNPSSQRRSSESRPASGLTPASDIANLPTGPSAQRPPASARPTPLPPQTPPPQIEDEDPDTKGFLPPSFAEAKIVDADAPDEENKTGTHDAGLADAATFGAGVLAADAVPHTPPPGQSPSPNPNSDDDWDALPPAPGQPIPSNVPDTPAATVTDTASRATPSRPLRTAATPLDPSPIVLGAAPPMPRSTGKTTKVLPPSAPVGIASPPPKPATPPPSTQKRNTGKTVAAGAAGALAGLAAGEALTGDATKTPSTPTRAPRNTGKTPAAPARPTPNTGKTPAVPARNAGAGNTLTPAGSISAISAGWPPPGAGSSRRTPPANRNRRRILIVALVILVLLVLAGLIVSARSNILGITVTPDATVTITPASKTVQDNYVLPSVNGASNIANREVGVHTLNSTKTATDTVTATGHTQIQAQAATGTLTFINGGASFDLAGGTTFNGPNGVTVATNTFITIPAAVSGVSFGRISVQGHATNPSAAGNMPDGAINKQTCCRNDGSITVTSGPFTGGQDAKNYTFLQPSDVTPVTNAHQTTLKNDAQKDINVRKKPSEQFLGDINCQTSTDTAGKPVGDKGVNVTSANVTISVTCNAQVYDVTAIQTIAENALKQKVSRDPTLAGYVLVDHILVHTEVQNDPTFSVTAKGVWSYDWTDAKKQALLNKIKGMTKALAQNVLNTYPGVSNPKIDIDNGGASLPNDVNQIKLVVNTVKGL